MHKLGKIGILQCNLISRGRQEKVKLESSITATTSEQKKKKNWGETGERREILGQK